MAEKKKKAKAADGEDDSTSQLLRIYRKKCESVNGVPISKLFKSKVEVALEEDEHVEKLHLWEEMGPVGARAMADSFTEISYAHLKQLRLWKVQCGDEGVRSICNYMMKAKTIEYLDLLDNQITPLGCEFLATVLNKNSEVPLKRLKLDHNNFGTIGLSVLNTGLAQNDKLEKISINHCGIDTEGCKYIQQMLSNIGTQLIKLRMQGNALKSQGVYDLFRVLRINTTLVKLNIADNQFSFQEMINPPNIGESVTNQEKLIQSVSEIMKENQNICFYDYRFNGVGQQDGVELIQCIEANKTICRVESDTLPQDQQDRIKVLTKKRKPKGKKKKGKGKKKK